VTSEPPGDDRPPGPEDTGDAGPERAESPELPDRRDDGLDLARALVRATAKAAPAARRKRRRPPRADAAGGRVSGAHPDDRDPQLLDATLSRLVETHGWGVDLKVHGVFGRWSDLVGPEVAAHCTPESFADGKLVVRTDSTAWATQLRLLAPTLVRRLNEELGHGTVTLIEVLGPHLPTWKKGPRSVRDGRGPRDTYG
jgi:predicted nucleic acid-binding Zn ribbon protein